MALTNIVGEDGDWLNVINMPSINGDIDHIMSEDEGMELFGQEAQGLPSHLANDNGSNMMQLPSLRGYPKSRIVNA